MTIETDLQALRRQNPKQDWPTALKETVAAVDQHLSQDEYAPFFDDVLRAWVYAGGGQALAFEETMQLVADKPWVAEREAEEAQKAAELETARTAAIAADTMSKGTPEDTSAQIAAVAAKLDWLMKRLGIKLEGDDRT